MKEGKIPEKTFLRPDEVAEILEISRRSVYRLIKQGELMAMRVGDRPLRIPRKELRDYIAETLLLPG